MTKKNDTPNPAKLTEIKPEAMEAVTQVQQLAASYNAERDLVNQLLGQAQMATASEDFFRTVRISKLAEIKDSKAYRGLKGAKTPNGSEFSGTWAEFCELLGKSVDAVDLDIKNLRTFGEQALDSMQKMGIGYRQLRDFRRLPEEEKTALTEVAETGDKDQFLELAEALIAKHQKEKAALTKERDDARADAEAKEAVLADKTARMAKLETQARKAAKRIETMPPDEEEIAIRAEAGGLCYEVEVLIRGQVVDALSAAQAHSGANDLPVDGWLEDQLTRIDQALLEVRGVLGLPREVTYDSDAN